MLSTVIRRTVVLPIVLTVNITCSCRMSIDIHNTMGCHTAKEHHCCCTFGFCMALKMEFNLKVQVLQGVTLCREGEGAVPLQNGDSTCPTV